MTNHIPIILMRMGYCYKIDKVEYFYCRDTKANINLNTANASRGKQCQMGDSGYCSSWKQCKLYIFLSFSPCLSIYANLTYLNFITMLNLDVILKHVREVVQYFSFILVLKRFKSGLCSCCGSLFTLRITELMCMLD